MSKKNKKSNQLKTLGQKYKKLPWPVFLVGVVLAIIVGYNLIYIPIVKTIERNQYNNVQEDMQELQQSIVAALGEPEKSEEYKSCGYSSAKFEKGTLGCGIHSRQEFISDNFTGSNEMLRDIHQSISTRSDFYVKYISDLSFVDTNTKVPQEVFIDLESRANTKIKCTMGVGLEHGTLDDQPTTTSDLIVSFSCYGHPIVEIYPLEQ